MTVLSDADADAGAATDQAVQVRVLDPVDVVRVLLLHRVRQLCNTQHHSVVISSITEYKAIKG